jgi:hypothetical protein
MHASTVARGNNIILIEVFCCHRKYKPSVPVLLSKLFSKLPVVFKSCSK